MAAHHRASAPRWAQTPSDTATGGAGPGCAGREGKCRVRGGSGSGHREKLWGEGGKPVSSPEETVASQVTDPLGRSGNAGSERDGGVPSAWKTSC